MPLQHLKISHFRNLSSVDIRPSGKLNIVYGANGSGKTSLLEAISMLAHARSFRTRKFRRLIQLGADGLTVFGRADAGNGGITAMGVDRRRLGASQFKIDGAVVRSAAELAAHLPLLIVNADSFGLLTGPPKQRRQFFDWLVFHVKPRFRSAWGAYSRSIKQRNSLLRHGKIAYSEVRPWDLEIARLSREIESERRACIDPFLREFHLLVRQIEEGVHQSADIEYVSGWRTDEPYEAQLAASFERDRKLSYTSVGPHKSDLKISINGIQAGELLSRGQQKSTIAALYIAAATTFSKAGGCRPVFLIDDMPAELDTSNIARVGQWLNEIEAQIFVTCIDYQPVYDAWPAIERESPALFHVEQGTVTPKV